MKDKHTLINELGQAAARAKKVQDAARASSVKALPEAEAVPRSIDTRQPPPISGQGQGQR